MEALSAYEVATGFPLGAGACPAPARGRSAAAHALAVLEELVSGALSRPPCVVQFSGGRDSSALLAVAARVARREGLALPVALTLCFPGEAEAEEGYWQDLVVRHLGLTDWAKVDSGEDADLVGPAAGDVLHRHGVIWSALLATRARTMALAAGGSLISGEGGDEVFGPHRATPLARLARGPRPRAPAHLAKASAGDLLPRRLRAEHLRARFAADLGLEWLRPEVREDYLGRLAAQWAAEPFPWARAVRWLTSCRHVVLAIANVAGLAAEAGAHYSAPFLDPSFVEALSGAFGPLGPPGRTAAMRSFFGGLLPDELLSRETKAVFTLPAWGPRTKEFVARWDGSGLDEELVDVEALRRCWAGGRPNTLTFGLLQQAWLASGT
ncbi:MAG: asparagine synthase-related protein [Acidimicrobiales bacterium]